MTQALIDSKIITEKVKTFLKTTYKMPKHIGVIIKIWLACKHCALITGKCHERPYLEKKLISRLWFETRDFPGVNYDTELILIFLGYGTAYFGT